MHNKLKVPKRITLALILQEKIKYNNYDSQYFIFIKFIKKL